MSTTQVTKRKLTKRGRERLLKLATFLEELPREKFDFSVIVEAPKDEAEALDHKSGKVGTIKCGTVGCAMGWLPTVFPRSFMWEMTDLDWVDDDEYVVGTVCHKESGRNDFFGAAQFFEISSAEADYLFAPYGALYDDMYRRLKDHGLGDDATPKQVAKLIRKFVSEKDRGTFPT